MSKNIVVNGINYEIPEFNLDGKKSKDTEIEIEKDAFILICGIRETGKTSIAKKILKKVNDKKGIIFCNNKDEYDDIRDSNNVNFVEDLENYKFNEVYDFIIIDDVLPTKDKDFIYRISSQLKSLKIIIIQDPILVPQYVVQFVDYILLFKNNNMYYKERLYRYYGEVFTNLETFIKFYDKFTENEIMVIDNFINDMKYAVYYVKNKDETEQKIDEMIKSVRTNFVEPEDSSSWEDDDDNNKEENVADENGDNYCTIL